MSEVGYVRIHRSLIGHAAFRNDGEAMAFAWMIARAAWKKVRVRYKDRSIWLARGQLAISTRDMAASMDRDKAWVERLWKKLKIETMIETHVETGVTIVTIKNYNIFQPIRDGAETPADAVVEAPCEAAGETPGETVARQSRDTEQRREEDKKKEDDDVVARVREALPVVIDFPSDLISITDEVCRAAGVRHVDPGSIIEHQKLVREWLDEGLDPQTHILPAVRTAVANAADRIHSLKWFATPVRQFRARMEANDHGHRRTTRDASQHPGGRTGAAADAVFGGMAGR